MISAADIKTAAIGPIFIPTELSSKKRIKPAPPRGMGAFPALLFLRLDVLLRADTIKSFNN